jgi:hypothetical protein
MDEASLSFFDELLKATYRSSIRFFDSVPRIANDEFARMILEAHRPLEGLFIPADMVTPPSRMFRVDVYPCRKTSYERLLAGEPQIDD